jgi:hypothetical protein
MTLIVTLALAATVAALWWARQSRSTPRMVPVRVEAEHPHNRRRSRHG